jgi:RsmE family RNA methyltransferase
VNLILLEPEEVGADGAVHVSGVRADHLVRVLKVAPGHQVRVGILDGPRGVGMVRALQGGAVQLHCVFDTPPPRPMVDVLLALPRPKVMRRLWAQLAALGVGQIIVTNAARVERQYFDTHVLTPSCYEPLLIEGLQQAQDTWRPTVSIHRQFRVLVEDHLDDLFPAGLRLLADPAATRSVGAVVRAHPGVRSLLAIGPEGGWNPFEATLLEAHGFERVGMGARTLRTDTACVALVALLRDAIGREE